MKLSQYKETYEYFTGKLSDINRQIAFAGIAIIWIFRITEEAGNIISTDLILPAILLMTALGTDMLQYIYQSALWAIFYIHKERKLTDPESDPNVQASSWFNYPTWILFSIKIALVIIAYIFILIFLFNTLI